MSKALNLIKFSFPYLVILLFIYLISNYYQTNKEEFSFFGNISLSIVLVIFFLCFLYLISETLILILIANHFNKKLSKIDSFLIICSTYFCNTFLQFSGLGFRAYYFKKFLKVDVFEFIILSLCFIYIELLVFSYLGFVTILVVDYFNDEVSLITQVKLFLFLVSLFMTIILANHKLVLNQLNKLNFLKKFSLFEKFISFFNQKKYLSVLTTMKKVLIFYVSQFLILTCIFYLGYLILDKENLLLMSLIASTFTDFSFIFTFTPYAIGISEAFLYVSNYNFDLKMSEILFLSNIFRLSMFTIYSPVASVFLIYFFYKKNN